MHHLYTSLFTALNILYVCRPLTFLGTKYLYYVMKYLNTKLNFWTMCFYILEQIAQMHYKINSYMLQAASTSKQSNIFLENYFYLMKL